MKTHKTGEHLGELETEIMNVVWKSNSVSVREVLDELKEKREIAYTTVMTVMNRLCDKGILRRRSGGNGAYIYSSVRSKEGFFALVSKRAINRLIKECGEVAVAQFIDIVESSNLKDLEEWRRKLKKIK